MSDIDFTTGYQHTIDGAGVDSPARFDVINPATEAVVGTAPDASADQLDAAVASAAAAQKLWAARPLAERQAAVAAIADAIDRHAEALKHLLTAEQGKPHAAAEGEIAVTAYWLREIAKQELPVETAEDSGNRRVIVRRVPLGVIGAITPWNYPILLSLWKVGPALVAGNTVVLKPSPNTPLTSLKIGEMLRNILPPGVLNVVSGGNALGAWMTAHSGIAKIAFTGSSATGRKIMEAASVNLKRITLELGGNDAAIILPDVDVDAVAPKLFWAAFNNSGQFCAAAKRIYIHEDVYPAMVDALVRFAATVKMGDGAEAGVELGPIQNRMQFDKVKDLLADCRDRQMRFLTGGTVAEGKGFFVPVTLIDNPPEDSRIVVEEPFGPVLPLLKFRDIDDVVARANDSEYGLGGTIWSKDIDAAEALAARLETGSVWINEVQGFTPWVIFGGHKQSGLGVENGIEGMLEYTNPQTIYRSREIATA